MMRELLVMSAVLATACGCPDYVRAPGAITIEVRDGDGAPITDYSGRVTFPAGGSLDFRCPERGSVACDGARFVVPRDFVPELDLELADAGGARRFSGRIALALDEHFTDGPACAPARNGTASVVLR